MGRGIAHVSAMGGFTTVLNDVSGELLDKARESIQGEMKKGVEIGKTTTQALDQAWLRLRFNTDLSAAVADVDLVIEAVPEQLDLKLDVFRRLDKICPSSVIFASNTSALSITEMAGATQRASQVVGMHFFNPVHKMKLVEIIRGLETSPDTLLVVDSVSKQMGKETVEVTSPQVSSHRESTR